MIDLYALPADYRYKVTSSTSRLELVRSIEAAMRDRLPSPQWIPYIQLHEFEALIYVDLDQLARYYSDRDLTVALRDLRSEIGFLAPEEINERPDFAPSKRLLRHIPFYGKAETGPAILEAIGLTKLRDACPHFDEWIRKLESLAT